MPGHVSLDFMAVSSYAKGTTTSGEVRLLKDLDTTLDGTQRRHRRGHRRHRPDAHLPAGHPPRRGPKSLRTACLLSKPSRRQVDVKVEYIGFTIEDRFVVGYGLDYAEQYRNLPHIAVARIVQLEPDPLSSKPSQRPHRFLTVAASRFASAMTAARSSVRTWRSFISTLPFTIVVRTSSPRVT